MIHLTTRGTCEPSAKKTEVWRKAAAAVAVGLVSAAALFASPGPASAEADFCGMQVLDINPGQDGVAALNQVLDQSQDSLIKQLAQGVHLGPEVCGPARFAMKVGASIVVGRTLLELYKIQTPGAADVLVGVHDALEQTQENNQPAVLPKVGGSAITAPVASTGGVGLWMNSDPTLESHTILIPEGEQVTLLCAVQGRAVPTPVGTSTLHDRVTWNGTTGYVADGYLNTGTNQAVVDHC